MPYYKLVPEHSGIEIYFEEKPSDEICLKLKTNGFRWHSVKKCWFAKETTITKNIADKICENSVLQPVSKKQVSFTQTAPNNVVSTVTISKNNESYKIHSTNNQIVCCDCNRFFSIHAVSCPFCGCPIDFVVKTYFERFFGSTYNTNSQPSSRESINEIKKQKINLMIKEYGMVLPDSYQKQLLKLDLVSFKRTFEHAKSIYLNKNLPQFIPDKFELIMSSDEVFSEQINKLEFQHRKRLMQEKINAELEEKKRLKEEQERKEQQRLRNLEIEKIRNKCEVYKLSEKTINSIVWSGISFSELEHRISSILYHQTKYPNINIDFSYYITKPVSELNKLIQDSLPKEKKIYCSGDCSSCKREKCLMDN